MPSEEKKPGKDKTQVSPLFLSPVSAGFPSPAEDYIERSLNLHELVVKNPPATFFIRVSGQSMVNAGIHDGDILVVDRSAEATDNKIVLCVLNGEFLVKRLVKQGQTILLMPENEKFKPIEIREGMDFKVWGVVTWAVHRV